MIWVEVLGRNREVVARHRCERLPATLGRGYSADVILDDPAIAALHLRIVDAGEPGRLKVEDLGTLSGVRVDNGGSTVSSATIDGDALLYVGGSCLRIRRADYGVPPERRVERETVDSVSTAAWLIVALGGLNVLQLWLNQTAEILPSTWIGAVVYPTLIAAMWGGAWSLVNRVFGGRARFARHFAIGLLGTIALNLIDPLTSALAYMLSAGSLLNLSFIPTCLLAAAVVLTHLRTVTLRRPALQFSLLGLATAVSLGLAAMGIVERAERVGPVTVVSKLLPPGLRVSAPVSGEEFLQAAAALSPELEKARLEEPKQSSGIFDFD